MGLRGDVYVLGIHGGQCFVVVRVGIGRLRFKFPLSQEAHQVTLHHLLAWYAYHAKQDRHGLM